MHLHISLYVHKIFLEGYVRNQYNRLAQKRGELSWVPGLRKTFHSIPLFTF